MIDQAENLKAGIRAKVVHPFRVIKRQFRFVKVRYRGLTIHVLISCTHSYGLRFQRSHFSRLACQSVIIGCGGSSWTLICSRRHCLSISRSATVIALSEIGSQYLRHTFCHPASCV